MARARLALHTHRRTDGHTYIHGGKNNICLPQGKHNHKIGNVQGLHTMYFYNLSLSLSLKSITVNLKFVCYERHVTHLLCFSYIFFSSIDIAQIKWVLSVPAIWSVRAKEFMREAAFQVLFLIFKSMHKFA